MKANTTSLINALILILLGSWGYVDSGMEAFTALIPVFVGLILVVVNKGVKNENKIAAHVAVLLTFLILLGLFRPFFSSIERNDTNATLRVGIMIASTIFAMVSFVRSFISARKQRESKN